MKHYINLFEPPKEYEDIVPKARETPPASFWLAVKSGAWFGIKWSTLIIGPILLVLLVAGIGLVAFVAFQHPQRIENDPKFWPTVIKMPFSVVGAFVISTMWIALFGAIAKGIAFLVTKKRRPA